MQMRTIIVGGGEIGQALKECFKGTCETFIADTNRKRDEKPKGVFDVMHIAFPPSDSFDEFVIYNHTKFEPKYVVIHSTVPVGTTKRLNDKLGNVVHSPVEGRHPNLTKSIQTFGKFIGYDTLSKVALEISNYFGLVGLKPVLVKGSVNTELGKIMSTTRLGWDVVFMKEVARLCEQYGADFEQVYTAYTKNYNQGYADMDQVAFSKFHRPVLENMPGPIGGHCVMANIKLFKSFLVKTIKEQNAKYE